MSTVDITPSPRVLRMLGQIDFAPWQCLAELIDNSIDAFLDQIKDGSPPIAPTIRVQLPTDAQLKAGTGQIVIADNAGGMTIEQIKDAVRAGYSGNDPVEKMGLFGMGFNISTARLGRKTEIWSTTSDSPDWVGLVIDFDELERVRAFQAPVQSRPKNADELAQPTHGTKIIISQLEADRIKPLIWGIGKRRTKDKLGKIYGRVMSSLDINILYDGDRVMPWKHCVWDEKRTVDTPSFGRVPAVIWIDEKLDARRFCSTCWVWLTQRDEACSSCGSNDNVIDRERTLRGWIGVQRYFDKQHYGIDLIRNGRVIEELDKSLFWFTDDTGESLIEYPIDATHWGGRIVGELEIDFVRVSHQKDSFDKLDPEWRHVVELVRGKSPMQPRIADRKKLPRNESPLARLFAGYRKGNAGLKDLVPGTEKGVGLNSGVVIEYRDRFYAGEAAYQNDEKWYELVLQVGKEKRGGSSGADDVAGDFPIDNDGPVKNGKNPTNGNGAGASPQPAPTPTPAPAQKDISLSRVYKMSDLPGSPEVNVEAFRHRSDIDGKAFSVRPESFNFRFDYNERSKFFEESLDTPLDCLLIDLAQHFMAVSSETSRNRPLASVVRALRDEYFPEATTTITDAADTCESLLDELRRHYDEGMQAKAPIELGDLEASQVSHIRQAALKAECATTSDVDRLIAEGRFARYVTDGYLIELVRRWPDVATDGNFFVTPYTALAEKTLKDQAATELVGCLEDALWLSGDGEASVSKDNFWRLRFARSLASLRMLQSWRA